MSASNSVFEAVRQNLHITVCGKVCEQTKDESTIKAMIIKIIILNNHFKLIVSDNISFTSFNMSDVETFDSVFVSLSDSIKSSHQATLY